MLILYILYGDPMGFVSILCFQSRQCDAATADYCLAGTVDGVSADRADIESAPQHIGGDILVGDVFSVH